MEPLGRYGEESQLVGWGYTTTAFLAESVYVRGIKVYQDYSELQEGLLVENKGGCLIPAESGEAKGNMRFKFRVNGNGEISFGMC